MTICQSAPLLVFGLALLGHLCFGIVGYAIGRITAKRGPTRTVETYQGEGIPF